MEIKILWFIAMISLIAAYLTDNLEVIVHVNSMITITIGIIVANELGVSKR